MLKTVLRKYFLVETIYPELSTLASIQSDPVSYILGAMETLVLNGKEYVKASKAARDLGYTSDYVGQLCRGGHVDAHLVGRTWYVNPNTLTAHRVEKKRNARVKAREYAKKAIEESRSLKINETKNSYKNIAIRYEGDKNNLIPEVRKVTVERTAVHQKHAVEEDIDASTYAIENENKKIIMSGVLTVQDAEVTPLPSDTVVLSPTFKRSVRKAPQSRSAISKESKTSIDEIPMQHGVAPKNFAERIQSLQNQAMVEDVPRLDVPIPEIYDVRSNTSTSLFRYILSILIVAVASVMSIYVEEDVYATSQTVTTNYSLNFEVNPLNSLQF